VTSTLVPPLAPRQLDAIREVASIGAGHAATALGTMLGHTILAQVPRIALVPCLELAAEVDAAATSELAVVRMGVEGHLLAHALVVLHGDDARAVAAVLTRRPAPVLGALERSAVQECANIVAGAYLAALAGLTGRTSMLAPPQLHCGAADAALGAALRDTACPGGTVLCIESALRVRDREVPIRAWFLLVPSPGGLHALLDAVGLA
jgi:chemotaxis protein CheC